MFVNSPVTFWKTTRKAGPDLAETVAFAVEELERCGYRHRDIQPVREMLADLFHQWQADVSGWDPGEQPDDGISPIDCAGVYSHTDLFIKLYAERYEPLVHCVDKLSLLVIMPILLLQDAADHYIAGALRAFDLLTKSRHCVACNSTGEIVFDEDLIQQANTTTDTVQIAKKRTSSILTELEESTIDNIVFSMEDQIVMEDLLCARTGDVSINIA
jgi:hypothetical protein